LVRCHRTVFDAAGVLTKVQPEIDNMLAVSLAKARVVAKDAEDTLKAVSDAGYTETFASGAALLRCRLEALRVVLDVPAAVDKAKTTEEATQLHEQAVSQYKKDKAADVSTGEPSAGFGRLSSWSKMERDLRKINIENEESEKKEKARIKVEMGMFEELRDRVKDQRNRLKRSLETAIDKVKKAEQKASEKERAAKLAEAQKVSAAVRCAAGAAPVKAEKLRQTFAIFEHDVQGLYEFPTATFVEVRDGTCQPDFQKPLLITDCMDLVSDIQKISAIAESEKRFTEMWKASPQRKPEGSGRGTKTAEASSADIAVAHKLVDALLAPTKDPYHQQRPWAL